MSDIRIKIPGDKLEFIKRMKSDDDGPFKTMAQVLAFAAAYGAAQHKPLPLTEFAPDPIRSEIFDREGLDSVINTIAIGYERDIRILSNAEELENKRIQIFEEFANRGLDLLQKQFKGEVDLTNALFLLLMKYRQVAEDDEGMDDLTGIFG